MRKLHPITDPHHSYQSLISFIISTLSIFFLMYLGDFLGEYFSWMEQNDRYLHGQQIKEILDKVFSIIMLLNPTSYSSKARQRKISWYIHKMNQQTAIGACLDIAFDAASDHILNLLLAC